MKTVEQVMRWVMEVEAKPATDSFGILRLPETASLEAIQRAFHDLARSLHPDLYHQVLPPAQLERLTRAYARLANAYTLAAREARAVLSGPTPRHPTASAPPVRATTTPPPTIAQTAKGQIAYRRAESALRRGDLQTALLQLRLAAAAEPGNVAIRDALAQVTHELSKN